MKTRDLVLRNAYAYSHWWSVLNICAESERWLNLKVTGGLDVEILEAHTHPQNEEKQDGDYSCSSKTVRLYVEVQNSNVLILGRYKVSILSFKYVVGYTGLVEISLVL